jgi:hypothetical protein
MKKSVFTFVGIVFSGLLLLPFFNSSAAAETAAKPQAVMDRYLSLDADAARLSESNWPAIQPIVTWPKPLPWDKIVVIETYKVEKFTTGSTRAQAKVTYRVIGELSTTFVAGKKTETVVYFLNKVGHDWKVDGPTLKPHVSFEVMKSRLAGNPLLEQIEGSRHANP